MLWHWRLETDRELFAKVVFPAYCDRPFNRMHRERFALEKVPCTRARAGVKRVKAAPRGNAKSTIDGFVDLVHDIVYAFEWFILIISDTASLSTDRVKDIKAEIESNEFLRWASKTAPGAPPRWSWTMPRIPTTSAARCSEKRRRTSLPRTS
jgi:hypothetical protein